MIPYEPSPPSPEFTSRLNELRSLIASSLDQQVLQQSYTELVQKMEERYRHQRDSDDLILVIEILGNFIESGRSSRIELAELCYKRSGYLAQQFCWSETMSNLDQVVNERRKCVDLSEPTDDLYSFYLSELAAAYHDRYEKFAAFDRDQTSQLNDLSEAQRLSRRSVSFLTDKQLHGHRCRAQLAIITLACFDRFEDPVDLDSIRRLISEDIAQPLKPDNMDFVFHRYALVRYYLTIYRQDRLETNLDSAILVASGILEAPEVQPDPRSICSLAECYLLRYYHNGDGESLQTALGLYKRALGTNKPGWRVPLASPNERALCHSGIASIFTELYKSSAALPDLEMAIEHNERAVETIGWSHPNLSTHQVNLALSYLERYKHLGDWEDYIKANRVIIFSAHLITSTPLKPATSALRAALVGIKMQHEYNAEGSNLDFYRVALETLPQVSWLGKDIALRQLSLTHQEIVTLAVDGAAWGVRGGKAADAVEILEEGRAITFRQLLELRSNFETLLPSAPELASEMKATAIALQNGSFARSSSSNLDPASAAEAAIQRQRDLADRWQTLLKKARTLPGMSNFLRARPFEELRTASKNGPVVILNCSDIRCDAIVLLTPLDDCHVVPLPNSSRSDAERMSFELKKALVQVGRTVRESRHFTKRPVNDQAKSEDILISVLAKLWSTVVQPVVEFLLPRCGKSQRVWWCPTGPYTSLPIHAAGVYASGSGPNIGQFFKSSYIPTLETLLRDEVAIHQTRRPKVLGIGMPNTPGEVPLPGTRAELESVRTSITPLQDWLQLVDAEAKVKDMLTLLSDTDWLHLACHGVQNVSEPLASSLILHDGKLELRQIMQAATKPGLVYLSACQTASGDRRMQDEAMHLAGGFLFAGFRGAIATMWSIDDQDGPTVASAVYQHLTCNGKVPQINEACEALHEAVDQLRRQGVSPIRWVPFIHLGV